MDGLATEHGSDREGEGRQASDDETGTQEEVEPAPFDREADSREQRHDPRRDRDRCLQNEANLRQRPVALEVSVEQEEAKRRPEQAEEEDLAPKKGLEIVSAVLPHVQSCRQTAARR